jgi:flagellar basal-body rod modification protein FlgD
MTTAISSTSGSSGSSTSSKISQIKPEDFLKIMVKEMQQQDPFEPLSSKDLMAQVGQIRDIQSSMDLTETLKELATSQKLTSAGGLIGKTVSGLSSSGDKISGVVVSARKEGDTINLELDTGELISLDNITEVVNKTETKS